MYKVEIEFYFILFLFWLGIEFCRFELDELCVRVLVIKFLLFVFWEFVGVVVIIIFEYLWLLELLFLLVFFRSKSVGGVIWVCLELFLDVVEVFLKFLLFLWMFKVFFKFLFFDLIFKFLFFKFDFLIFIEFGRLLEVMFGLFCFKVDGILFRWDNLVFGIFIGFLKLVFVGRCWFLELLFLISWLVMGGFWFILVKIFFMCFDFLFGVMVNL